MNIQIIEKPLFVDLWGLSGKVTNHNFSGAGVNLMNKMWDIVKSKNLKNTGINFWYYDSATSMFTGVELVNGPGFTDLELKKVSLKKYAYWKHIGPYEKIKDVYPQIEQELKKRKIKFHYPFLEKYGHYTEDTSKLETEMMLSVD